jgi:hypothetical protein
MASGVEVGRDGETAAVGDGAGSLICVLHFGQAMIVPAWWSSACRTVLHFGQETRIMVISPTVPMPKKLSSNSPPEPPCQDSNLDHRPMACPRMDKVEGRFVRARPGPVCSLLRFRRPYPASAFFITGQGEAGKPSVDCQSSIPPLPPAIAN